MNVDPNGYSWKKIYDCVKIVSQVYNAIAAMSLAVISGKGNDIISDFKNGSLNPFNCSEQVALNT